MKAVKTIRRVVRNADASTQALAAIREGTANQSALINAKLTHLIGLAEAQVALLEQQNELLAAVARQDYVPVDVGGIVESAVNKAYADSFQRPPQEFGEIKAEGTTFEQAMASMPLMIAEKTYNTSHPDYDARKARNFPGKIFNYRKPSANIVYKELLKMAKGDEIPEDAWRRKLPEILEEAKSVPGADQVFDRINYIKRYMEDLAYKYGAHYKEGWVNLDDAIFLYWVVRTLKPRTIVQTGVCNGLSSAFMMLGLAKNGPEGKLYVVDLPPIFDSKDPAWTEKGKVYGVCIPEGKSSGWIVPDQYKNRFFVQVGDAKEWLPKVMDKLTDIDLFYHDSDHTYHHMMFEFAEAKKKLNPGGVILGDDVSWNASVWDFADKYGVPSYNYLGTVGAAFF